MPLPSGNAPMISADDLSYFLQVARQRRLTLAAHALGVNHTTVGRRITRLEEQLGQRLFDRRSQGWALTEVGERLMVHAETVEDALSAATTVATDSGAALSGSVRIVAPDGFGAFLLAPALGPLRKKFPELTIEIMTVSQRGSFTEREFDVAVVLVEPSQHAVWSQPLLDYTLRLYASRDYFESHPAVNTVDDLRKHTLIFYVDEALDINPLRIMSEILPDHTARIQINNITGHWKATAAGLGISPLPSYIGDNDDSLISVLPDQVSVQRRYWIVVPRGLQRLRRVREVVALVRSIPLTSHTIAGAN